MMMNRIKKIFVLVVLFFCSLSMALAQNYNITDFGAVGDNQTDNTIAIRKAIGKAATQGGTVIVPAGIFITGTVELKSNVTLQLNKNGVIKGVADRSAYVPINVSYPLRNEATPSRARALIYAVGKSNINITGEGTVDGNGGDPVFDEKLNKNISRPYGMFFLSCKNLTVSNIHLTNSAMWMQHYLNCDFLRIQNITVFNHANLNNDGLDIDDCHDVIISGCLIDADDDALCFKSEGDRGVKNAVVTNCILSSHASAFKMGTGSVAGFEAIQFSNSVIRPSLATNMMHPYKQKGGLAGIDLASTDGAVLKNISISGISIDSVETPIFIKLGNRLNRSSVTPANKQGIVENIQISQINIKNAGLTASAITGYPGAFVRNITLRDIFIAHNGGGSVKDTSLNVPENSNGYPLNKMFGKKLPACGFYIRHVKDLKIYNVQVMLSRPDARPSIVLDDTGQAVLSDIDCQINNPVQLCIANSRQVAVTYTVIKPSLRLIHSTLVTLNNQDAAPGY